MKEEFAKLMYDQNFRSASELIIKTTFKLQVPENVNLNINTDYEQNIKDLAAQMKNCYDQINAPNSEISFETLLANVFSLPQASEKQSLKTNDQFINKAKTEYDNALKQNRIKQYEQIFETTTLTINSTLQSILNSVIKH